jgi:aarF domain-containing kinase
MISRQLISKVVRRTAYGLGAVSVTGVSAVAVYTSTEQGLGLHREIRFWSEVTPIIFDYWFHASSSSPLVKYQNYRKINKGEQQHESSTDNNDDDHDNQKAEIYNSLHERNAPKILNVMLDLGGLYIKLGQVLSVTALPVPKRYRELFRTLQSNVPGHEEFEKVVKPTLEKELGCSSLDEIFEFIEEVPCGAASIGQAHRARLKKQFNTDNNNDDDDDNNNSRDVIVKVQYPSASWQIPADIQCVGDFLKLCVYFGVVEESSAKLSYAEFSRQFLSELDYQQERQNLEEVYESSLDHNAPYIRRGVIIPKVFPQLCTKRVITMSYLPGPKFEEEARKQLESLGVDTSRGMREVVKESVNEMSVGDEVDRDKVTEFISISSSKPATKISSNSWIVKVIEASTNNAIKIVGMDNLLFLVRLSRKLVLWSTAAAVRTIRIASERLSLVPEKLDEWAVKHESAASQARMLEWTNDAIDALFDVHGYQIFNKGLFNADSHPGNILILEGQKQTRTPPKIGLIDYGQCKRLNSKEREKVAKLIVSVANNDPDETIASHFRALGIKTKNDSTRFLGEFARLMFGPFRPEHMKHDWHKALHKEDQVLYFPNELSMVYRTSLLLRGLAMSFQINVSVSEKWRQHAETAIDR